jgi:hypothetical protein
MREADMTLEVFVVGGAGSLTFLIFAFVALWALTKWRARR